MIGQCGLTIQDCAGEEVLEVGYLLRKEYWHQGYATEAAKGCVEYAFTTLFVPAVYALVRDNNPVSYTHLDVYKRQAANCSFKALISPLSNIIPLTAVGSDIPPRRLTSRCGDWAKIRSCSKDLR